MFQQSWLTQQLFESDEADQEAVAVAERQDGDRQAPLSPHSLCKWEWLVRDVTTNKNASRIIV